MKFMTKLRCAVIGVGYLGRFHAQKYQLLSESATLVAVCDQNQTLCDTVANELGVPGYADYRLLFDKVDAVSIAATTIAHYDIAKACLMAGLHVLLEKPITETVEQANELIALAAARDLKLQVGHLERFNAARLALEPYLENPLFIESQRLAPFNPRGTDVDVVLDLMIHDIDMIQAMVQRPITHIDAQGAPVLSKAIDIANARITFDNGTVANITASRISFKTERKMRIFQKDTYISIDYHSKQLAVFSKGTGEMFPGIPDIVQHQSVFDKGDALLAEICAFVDCIQQDTQPLVTGDAGRAALETAAMIAECIHTHLNKHHAFA